MNAHFSDFTRQRLQLAGRLWTSHGHGHRARWAHHQFHVPRPQPVAGSSGAHGRAGPHGLSPQASHDPIHFSELPLDRAAHLRSQPDELQRLLRSPTTTLIPLHRGKALVGPPPSLSSPLLLLKLASGEQLPLAPHTFSSAHHTAEGLAPKWVPLVLSSSQHAALEPASTRSMGFLFLGLTPGDAHAVFAFDLAEAAEVYSGGLAPSGAVESVRQEGHVEAPSAAAATAAAGTSSPAAAAVAEAGPAGEAALCQWADVRAAGQGMAGGDAALLALATGLARWHASAAFCTRTGRPMAAVSGGHARAPASGSTAPPQSGNSSSGSGTASSSSGGTGAGNRPSRPSGERAVRAVYPRVDPAVIVAATCGDWLLLGRKKSWEAGRYSLLAGFCEVGETLEQAAVREVQEESGVLLDPSTLTYHSSQPWPFPQSLMIGFTGGVAGGGAHPGPPFHLLSDFGRMAAHDVGMTQNEIAECLIPAPPEIKVDTDELEDARWFHRSYLRAALPPIVPLPAAPAPVPAGGGNADTAIATPSHSPASPWAPRHTDPLYYPRIAGEGLRIPGQYALANRIIWGWLRRGPADAAAAGTRGAGSKEAISASQGGGKAGPWIGDLLPDVSIDEGTFKYVLLRVTEVMPDSEGDDGTGSGAPRSKLIVRGDGRAAYHDHILRAARAEAAALQRGAAAVAGGGGQPAPLRQQPLLRIETLGGGRMEHFQEQRVLSVYGYSSAFGQAPHEAAAGLLRRWLPFHEVVVSYEGY